MRHWGRCLCDRVQQQHQHGESMSNVKSAKSSRPLFLISISTIAIAASACKLDPPAITSGVGGNGQMCADDMGMPGMGGSGGSIGGTGTGGGAGQNNIDNVVM